MTRNLWRVLFLGVAALWTGMEVYAANDHDPNTEPLTTLVVDHVPATLALTAGAGGLAWVVEHFWTRYQRKRLRDNGDRIVGNTYIMGTQMEPGYTPPSAQMNPNAVVTPVPDEREV